MSAFHLVSGSFTDAEIHSVHFSQSFGNDLDFSKASMILVDFSYSSLKRARFSSRSNWLQINFYRANLQESLLDNKYFNNLSRLNNAHVDGAQSSDFKLRDPNLISKPPGQCYSTISDKWESNVNDKVPVYQDNHDCQFILNSNAKQAVLSQKISLDDNWNRTLWPISYAVLDANVSNNVKVELIGVNNMGRVINSKIIGIFLLCKHRFFDCS